MEGPFRRPLPADLRLIETFGWRPDTGAINLPEHLARLERSARLLGVPFDRAAVDRLLETPGGDAPLRLRLTLGVDGVPDLAATPMPPGPSVWTIRLAEDRLDPADPWLRIKSTERRLYDDARAGLPAGVDEWLFLNRRGEVSEGTIFNVFLELGGILLTPPLSSGLLPGVLRQLMLDRGRAREAVLRPEDLARGRLFLGNSLRGLCRARFER